MKLQSKNTVNNRKDIAFYYVFPKVPTENTNKVSSIGLNLNGLAECLVPLVLGGGGSLFPSPLRFEVSNHL